jgi:hypothetical protein
VQLAASVETRSVPRTRVPVMLLRALLHCSGAHVCGLRGIQAGPVAARNRDIHTHIRTICLATYFL